MEDDGPAIDDCKIPGLIINLEEGSGALSRGVSTQTSVDGKVERPVGHLRSGSRLSPDRGPGEEEGEEARDADGNNNNSGGGAGRGARAAGIQRRNLWDLSPRYQATGRMQRDTEPHDHVSESDECKKSDVETAGAGEQNEPTRCESVSLDVDGVSELSRDVEAGRAAPDGPVSATGHICCTVYCIANEGLLKDPEVPHREAVTEMDSESDAGSNPESNPNTVHDPVDPPGEEGPVGYCWVCMENVTIVPLYCCRKAVCDECLMSYISSQVRKGKVDISCPMLWCKGSLEKAVVIAHLAKEYMDKYQYFLELSQLDSSTKACPYCSHFTSLKEHNPSRSEDKYKIQCSSCRVSWCFKCHAPWHDGIKCRDYMKGDKQLENWASVVENGQRNAQRCPHCKIHIQRSKGCDSMICTQCNTNFCYRCGKRHRHLCFFGGHTSTFSVFGCKYHLLPNNPFLRWLIRGSVCATKLLIGPVVILLVVGLGPIALVIGPVVFLVLYVNENMRL